MYMFALFTISALLGGCRTADIHRHMDLLNLENSIDNLDAPTKHPGPRRFISLKAIPEAEYLHAPGSILELTCEAIGIPAPSIRWLRNNKPVFEHDAESSEMLENSPNSFGRIVSRLLVTHTEGTDVYTCVASSAKKVARATTAVHSTGEARDASERTKLLPQEPYILVTYLSLMDTIGSSVVLPCKARGHPRPRVLWRDNKGVLASKNPRVKILRSGELMLSGLRWKDMGQWTCTASNSFGSKTSSTFLYPTAA